MSDSAFASHVVSQTRANIDFLQAQGYLTLEDATSIRSKLAAVTANAPGKPASLPVSIPTPAPAHQPQPPNPPQPTLSYPRARVLWAYNEDGRESNDLAMSVGDIIDIVEEINADWWTGRNKGKQGLFPSNYVQKLPPEAPSQPYNEKSYGAPGYTDHGNHHPPQQVDPDDNAPAVGLQQDEGQDKKKKKFGKFGNTMAHSAAGGLGFGAGAAVGSGLINAIF